MQDNISNAHRLIGETIRDPVDDSRGKIVGVDQSRAVPVIFVIWQGQPGIERAELTRDALRQLADACCRSRAAGRDQPVKNGVEMRSSSRDEISISPAVVQRRVGAR